MSAFNSSLYVVCVSKQGMFSKYLLLGEKSSIQGSVLEYFLIATFSLLDFQRMVEHVEQSTVNYLHLFINNFVWPEEEFTEWSSPP